MTARSFWTTSKLHWIRFWSEQDLKHKLPNALLFAGMIVPEELETHKEEAPKEQQQGANTGAEPQGASASEGEAGVQALEQEQPNTASEIKTAVTTEDMSVEQTSDDNNGKPEGWSAELEQPKISTAVETEVLPLFVSTGDWTFPVSLPSFWALCMHIRLKRHYPRWKEPRKRRQRPRLLSSTQKCKEDSLPKKGSA